MTRRGRYRTARRFTQLVELDARLVAEVWMLRLVHSEVTGLKLRFHYSLRIRRYERLRALVAERLNEIIAYGKADQ